MRKTQYHKPYFKRKGQTKARFRRSYFGNKPGVYIIRRGKKIVYVGHSQSNVYKTMYRHFQSWYDPTQHRVTYPKFSPEITCKIILCTANQAPRLESILVRRYKPEDNTEKLELIFQELESYTQKQYSNSKSIPKTKAIEDPF
jgi:hypothetical protein